MLAYAHNVDTHNVCKTRRHDDSHLVNDLCESRGSISSAAARAGKIIAPRSDRSDLGPLSGGGTRRWTRFFERDGSLEDSLATLRGLSIRGM